MKTFGKVLAILYTIFFGIILFGFIIVFTVTSYFKADFFTNLITSDAFMATKLTDIELDPTLKEDIIQLCGEDCTVEDAIVSAASEGLGVSEPLIREALKDEDIQEAIGDAISYYTNSVATGRIEPIKYEDYEHLLKKEVVQKILKELDITEEDIKILIEEYNKSAEEFNNNGGMEGVQTINARAK